MLEPRGIRVNLVCPGIVRTPMTERAVAQRPERAAFIDNLHPMGRIAEPDDVGDRQSTRLNSSPLMSSRKAVAG